MMRSRFSMILYLPNRPNFFRNVDAGRAPRYAPSAPYASRAAELVNPRGQLVGHPLPVAGLAGIANVAPVDVREPQRETRIPAPPALGVIASNIGDVFDGGAEARGAHHRAIRTCQASACNFVPPRMLEIPVEQFLDAGGVDASHLLPRCGFDGSVRLL